MKKLAVVFLLSGLLFSCETDFETIAPWRETMVVYGLLNPFDNVQYIRISKAYLGEGNALQMGQISDSIYYADVLQVKLERFVNNQYVEGQLLSRIDTIPKESGTFAAPYQVIYAYTLGVPSSTQNDGSEYRLTITNTQTGNVVTAKTKIIESFSVLRPISQATYKFNTSLGLTWRMNVSDQAKIYGVRQKINYIEVNTITNDTVKKSIDWFIGDKVVAQGQTELLFPFESNELYRLLGDNIDVDPDKTRRLDFNPIDVYIAAGTEDLYTYMQVSEENTGIIQDKPPFTNIENGIGLFTSRNFRKITIQLHPDTYAALDTSDYTKNLNFTH
jgi:hypothetical protein